MEKYMEKLLDSRCKYLIDTIWKFVIKNNQFYGYCKSVSYNC